MKTSAFLALGIAAMLGLGVIAAARRARAVKHQFNYRDFQ